MICYLKSSVGELTPSGHVHSFVAASARERLSCPNVDGTESNGFIIECGQYYPGVGDIGGFPARDLETCADRCDSTDDCVAAAFTGNACYLKNGISSSSVPNPGVIILRKPGAQASPTPEETSEPEGLHCPTNDGQTVGEFTIHCNQDFWGGDLTSLYGINFGDCIAACEENTKCVDVSFQNGACYLKSKLTTMQASPDVWTAVRTPRGSQPDTFSGPTCPNDDGKEISSAAFKFTVACDADYAGGDLSSGRFDTFAECVASCDNNDECVDVVYNSAVGACYLKSTVTSVVANPGHWAALKGEEVPIVPDETVPLPDDDDEEPPSGEDETSPGSDEGSNDETDTEDDGAGTPGNETGSDDNDESGPENNDKTETGTGSETPSGSDPPTTDPGSETEDPYGDESGSENETGPEENDETETGNDSEAPSGSDPTGDNNDPATTNPDSEVEDPSGSSSDEGDAPGSDKPSGSESDDNELPADSDDDEDTDTPVSSGDDNDDSTLPDSDENGGTTAPEDDNQGDVPAESGDAENTDPTTPGDDSEAEPPSTTPDNDTVIPGDGKDTTPPSTPETDPAAPESDENDDGSAPDTQPEETDDAAAQTQPGEEETAPAEDTTPETVPDTPSPDDEAGASLPDSDKPTEGHDSDNTSEPQDPTTLELTCPSETGTTYTSGGVRFQVDCASAYGGADIFSDNIGTLQGCVDKCAETPNCVSLSYFGVGCYLKGVIGSVNHGNPGVMGARVISSRVERRAFGRAIR